MNTKRKISVLTKYHKDFEKLCKKSFTKIKFIECVQIQNTPSYHFYEYVNNDNDFETIMYHLKEIYETNLIK